MNRSFLWPLVIVLSAIAALLAMVFHIGVPLQPLLAFWFMLVCPGMAFVRLFQLKDHLTELILGVALSLGLNTVTAEIMVISGLWSAFWGLVAIASLSLIGVLLQIRSVHRVSTSSRHLL